jgi:acetylornithine deacetylase/succinyl-diaminopimelate desuccinylase-like protein
VLLHALASLHDEHGDVAVEGLRRDAWTGVTDTDEEFRELAEVEPGLPFFGTGGLGERLWTGPAITVTGIDAPSVDRAVNAVAAHARARLNVRIHPEQDAAEAQAAVIRHLEAQRPFGVPLRVHAGDTGDGFRSRTSGPAWDAMVSAMQAAWGGPTVQIATGGAIPLVKALSDGVPEATVLLYGTTDKFANIHGPNERVLVGEFEKAVLAEALYFQELASRWEGAR